MRNVFDFQNKGLIALSKIIVFTTYIKQVDANTMNIWFYINESVTSGIPTRR